jgi:hypothetical protein
MALPQRRDPYEDEHQRELDELQRRRAADVGGGSFMGWWWIWLLILVCAIWFAGWGWGGYGGWWWGGALAVTRTLLWPPALVRPHHPAGDSPRLV